MRAAWLLSTEKSTTIQMIIHETELVCLIKMVQGIMGGKREWAHLFEGSIEAARRKCQIFRVKN